MAAVFVIFTLAFAAAYWYLVVLWRRHLLPFSMEESIPGRILWAVLRAFGPAIVAIVSVLAFQGKHGLLDLGRAVVRWKVPGRIYLLGLLGPFAVSAIALAVGLATATMVGVADRPPVLKLLAMFFFMAVMDGPLGEEIGWRGLLLPALLRETGPLLASVILGVIWAVWHVPLYVADGRGIGLAAWAFFLAQTTAYSVVFTWFFLRAQGSVFFCIFFHNTTNYAIFTLLMKLWHPIGDATLPRVVWGLLVFAAAVAAGISLLRTPRPPVATPLTTISSG